MPPSDDKTTFLIDRIFKAPRERVWKAWSDAAQLGHWWGPKGCAVEVFRFEFRPGGFFHYAMKFPNSFSNENCGIARAPFSEDCPLEIENSVNFTERDGSTIVSLRARPFGESAAERQYFEDLHPSMAQGYGGTFDQLSAHLES
jgi:hypothetical protein